jgi:hypothetical protein
MKTSGTATGLSESAQHKARREAMTLSQLRHDIRNQLNAIKLSVALLQRRTRDGLNIESLNEIDRAADDINGMITRFLGDADAPTLLLKHPSET